jgi:hypothetical protein
MLPLLDRRSGYLRTPLSVPVSRGVGVNMPVSSTGLASAHRGSLSMKISQRSIRHAIRSRGPRLSGVRSTASNCARSRVPRQTSSPVASAFAWRSSCLWFSSESKPRYSSTGPSSRARRSYGSQARGAAGSRTPMSPTASSRRTADSAAGSSSQQGLTRRGANTQ